MNHSFQQWVWNDVLAEDCRRLVRLAVLEDLDRGYDWTTVALVNEQSKGRARVIAREPGLAAGLAAIPVILDEMDVRVEWAPDVLDGQSFPAGTCLGDLTGNARDLLTCERLILNLVGRLSGIATLTAAYVVRIENHAARVFDTRKTCPGYRHLEKYAVHCGGGCNHRTGLYDAILIKDNHLALGAADQRRRYSPAEAVMIAKQFVTTTFPTAEHPMTIEIEVDTLLQFELVLPTQPDLILLDNMPLADLAAAVQRRNYAGSRCLLEASGGVNLETIDKIAGTGVDRISVGALTHSARCLDIGLDWSTP